MLMNEKRAEWGRHLASRLMSMTGAEREDAVADSLANLMHLCQQYAQEFGSFEDCLDRAKRNFAAELTEDADNVFPEVSMLDREGVPDFSKVFNAAMENVTSNVERVTDKRADYAHEDIVAAIREREEMHVRVDMMKQILLATDPDAIDEIRANFRSKEIKCDCYLDAVESQYGADANLFDAVEIHGIRIADGLEEMDDQATDAFGVFLHLKTGGVEQVGEFNSPRMAEDYAKFVGGLYAGQVYNYSFSARPVAKASGLSM